MKPSVWRVVMLTAIALSIAFVFYEMTLPGADDFGLDTQSNSNAVTATVVGVTPGSPAANAGIHKGDMISYGKTQLDIARVAYATPGTRVTVVVNGVRRVTFVARRRASQTLYTGDAIRFAFLLVAGILAWRRPEDAAVRPLVAFLTCYGLAIAMVNGILPTPELTLMLDFAASVLIVLGTSGAVLFAARFPSGNARPVPRYLGLAALIISALCVIANFFALFTPADLLTVRALISAALVVLVLVFAATLIVAYAQSASDERQRRKWVFAILAGGLAGPLADIVTEVTIGLVRWLDNFALVTLALIPFGFAYVILRHRVIDVGFVINRTLVYGSISLVIVGIFVVLETLLAKYVEATNHLESTAVQLAVALVLGFSIRPIHSRIDAIVDRLIFRERHRNEAALRTFAHEAGYFTDAHDLLARCVTMVQRHAGSGAAGVWIADAARYRPAESTFAFSRSIGENDPAFVAMRARRAAVDVAACDSDLPGVLALPMIARGELLGALVCAEKASHEAYDPDERETLAYLAAATGHALDAIEVRELRSRLAALGATREGASAL